MTRAFESPGMLTKFLNSLFLIIVVSLYRFSFVILTPINGDRHVFSGARIIKGMPSGFYDGYTEEIHEVYIYDIK